MGHSEKRKCVEPDGSEFESPWDRRHGVVNSAELWFLPPSKKKCLPPRVVERIK